MKKTFFTRLLVLMLCLPMVFVAFLGCGGAGEYDVELSAYVYGEGTKSAAYNKDLFYRNNGEEFWGDPTVVYVEEDGKPVLYSTGTGTGTTSIGNFSIYRSTDFHTWELAAKNVIDMEGFYGTYKIWAPQFYYDAEATYEEYNIEKLPGESGKGLYFLSFSAVSGDYYSLEYDGIKGDYHYITTVISKNPDGPYTFFEGTNLDGLKMDASVPIFNLEYINPKTGINLDEGKNAKTKLYHEVRQFIDQAFFVDPVTGDKYMYMSACKANLQEIWGVKMKNWVTPDYTTVTRLTTHGLVNVYGTKNNDNYGYQPPSGSHIDEGPFTVYHNGKFYLTFSIGGNNCKMYSICQAIGDTPLGPFTKVQPEDGGLLCTVENGWDMWNSGHHAFVDIGDEMYIVYHSMKVHEDWSQDGRTQRFDKILWTTNDKGQEIMVANGPSVTPQALPKVFTDYVDVSESATVTATGGVEGTDAKYLNDSFIRMHNEQYTTLVDFEAKEKTTITLTWDDYVGARAIMVYNSCEFMKIFDKIGKLTLYYKDKDGNEGKAIYNDWAFDSKDAMIPYYTLYPEEELEGMDPETYIEMRGSTPAIIEFADIQINKIEIEIEKADYSTSLGVSEIVVLGKYN